MLSSNLPLGSGDKAKLPYEPCGGYYLLEVTESVFETLREIQDAIDIFRDGSNEDEFLPRKQNRIEKMFTAVVRCLPRQEVSSVPVVLNGAVSFPLIPRLDSHISVGDRVYFEYGILTNGKIVQKDGKYYVFASSGDIISKIEKS